MLRDTLHDNALARQVCKIAHREPQGFRGRLQDLRQAGAEAWQDFKGGVDAAVKDLRQAVTQAASRFEQQETQ